MKTCIQTLPTEVLDIIVTKLLYYYCFHSYPRNCLLDLSLVSHRLNQVTNTILYRSVYYRSYNDDEAPTGPGEVPHEAPYIPPARIFHLGYFVRTLEGSPALRALVLDVDIAWIKTDYTSFTEQRILRIPKLLGSSARSLLFGPPESYSSVATFSAITSLSLTYSADFFFMAPPLNTLYRLCKIPTLRRLSLFNWPQWDFDTIVDNSYPCSSNITHLSLYRSGQPGPLLTQVLTWPKALESFIFQSYRYEMFYPAEHRKYSPQKILDSLQPQRESLQSLLLVINSNKWEANSTHESDGTTMRDFSDFKLLKRLCISRELLGFPAGRGFPRAAFEIDVVLPLRIEQFHVDIQFSGSWEQLQSMHKKLDEPLALGVFAVLDCLQRIVMQRAEVAPGLKRIVIYCGTYSKERKSMAEDKTAPFRQLERARVLKDAAVEAGVKILAWTNWRRPLWEDWTAAGGLR